MKTKSSASPAVLRTEGQSGVFRYLNRELSLLAFNERVLALAEDPDTPLLERLRYVCIVSNNIDEVFEIRVSGLKAKLDRVWATSPTSTAIPQPRVLRTSNCGRIALWIGSTGS